MASHRAPKKSAKAVVTLATATASSVVLVPSIASASPTPSVSQVKQQVDQLNQQAESATQQYDGANAQLGTLQKQVDQLQARISQEQSHVSALENSLGSLAAAQYRSGGIDQTLQTMLSQHPDQYLQQTTTMTQVSANQAASLAQVKAAQRQLQQDKAQAGIDLAQLQNTRTQLATKKNQIQTSLQKEQRLLSQLTAAERAAVVGPLDNSVAPGDLPPVSGRVALAIDYAKSKLGDPYSWGSTGPSSFDCSGLVMEAWAAAGVSIPRTTQAEMSSLPSVPRSDLQPGDLVFFYGGDHVGLYVGANTVIHAPHTGEDVQYASIDSMPYAGAARP